MADLTKLVEEIKTLSLVEVSDLVKMLEEEFGVSAAAATVVAGPVAGLQQLKKKQNSTLLSQQLMQAKKLLQSKQLEKSLVLDLVKLKLWLKVFQQLLKKTFLKLAQKN